MFLRIYTLGLSSGTWSGHCAMELLATGTALQWVVGDGHVSHSRWQQRHHLTGFHLCVYIYILYIYTGIIYILNTCKVPVPCFSPF